MKQGRTLAELDAELERQRNARKDYLVNTSALSMKTQDGKSIVQFENGHEMETYQVGDIAHQQLATRLGIPFRYYLKMQKDYPALLDENVNGWLHKEPERRMLRTLDGRMRAFLSARYRRLDNPELCAAVLPIIQCPHGKRCMFRPTLRAIAKSLHRGIKEPTVTELIAGVRETHLKRTTDYAVDPQDVLYALHGQAVHTINENFTDGDMLSEVRLSDMLTSGKFDLYGNILNNNDGVLRDLKVTSSYKLMKALGIYKERVPVQEMYIQAMCRDNNLRIAAERGITQFIYVIPINRISDRWILRYFHHKAEIFHECMKEKKLPPICSTKERWNDRKCEGYCDARANCPYAQRLAREKEAM